MALERHSRLRHEWQKTGFSANCRRGRRDTAPGAGRGAIRVGRLGFDAKPLAPAVSADGKSGEPVPATLVADAQAKGLLHT